MGKINIISLFLVSKTRKNAQSLQWLKAKNLTALQTCQHFFCLEGIMG